MRLQFRNGGGRGTHGFTLVELLIVVIILSILAAIVVPQFASSTDDAKLASLDTTLSNMRASLDLYYQQHGEYPSANADGGVGAANSATAFLTQLSQYTDGDGNVSTSKTAVYKYGPYLRKSEIPSEPMTQSNSLKIETTGTLGLTAEAGDPGGWRYDNVTGQFIVNHSSWQTR